MILESIKRATALREMQTRKLALYGKSYLNTFDYHFTECLIIIEENKIKELQLIKPYTLN